MTNTQVITRDFRIALPFCGRWGKNVAQVTSQRINSDMKLHKAKASVTEVLSFSHCDWTTFSWESVSKTHFHTLPLVPINIRDNIRIYQDLGLKSFRRKKKKHKHTTMWKLRPLEAPRHPLTISTWNVVNYCQLNKVWSKARPLSGGLLLIESTQLSEAHPSSIAGSSKTAIYVVVLPVPTGWQEKFNGRSCR